MNIQTITVYLNRNCGARHLVAALRDNRRLSSPLAEASPLLTVPHLKLFRKDPGNEVCHLTLATSLGREYLNSPRSPDLSSLSSILRQRRCTLALSLRLPRVCIALRRAYSAIPLPRVTRPPSVYASVPLSQQCCLVCTLPGRSPGRGPCVSILSTRSPPRHAQKQYSRAN